ncbi:oxidoreductase [Aspergillus karnatakaensis]|uniref:oxidoreductase, short chain dehydrogenase/reductase family n=1 Tax=Aspergillus karnatakaensis TaxID=1810916 RepID=UPI003CCE38E6
MASESAREALTKRQVPSMLLSTGSATSMTAPLPSSTTATPQEAAQSRFSITGNAVVTGGAGILGLQACSALLEHGLSGLMILDMNPATSETEITALRSRFPTAKIYAEKADITDEVAIDALFTKTAELLGSVDILLNFAGIVGCADALTLPVSAFRKVLDVNTTGSFICAQAAARQMVAQGTGGSIVFIASISAHRVNYPQPQVAYNVSKTGLIMMKNSLAAEWARYGIRTNSISPGYMDTILNEGNGLEEHRRIWAERNPFGRMGSPRELAGAVVLLCSREGGAYINGADLVVDGGGVVF